MERPLGGTREEDGPLEPRSEKCPSVQIKLQEGTPFYPLDLTWTEKQITQGYRHGTKAAETLIGFLGENLKEEGPFLYSSCCPEPWGETPHRFRHG